MDDECYGYRQPLSRGVGVDNEMCWTMAYGDVLFGTLESPDGSANAKVNQKVKVSGPGMCLELMIDEARYKREIHCVAKIQPNGCMMDK